MPGRPSVHVQSHPTTFLARPPFRFCNKQDEFYCKVHNFHYLHRRIWSQSVELTGPNLCNPRSPPVRKGWETRNRFDGIGAACWNQSVYNCLWFMHETDPSAHAIVYRKPESPIPTRIPTTVPTASPTSTPAVPATVASYAASPC